MVKQESLDRLYGAVINNQELTTSLLNEMGFNSNNINELIEQGIIARIKRGFYEFIGYGELYYYGKRLIASGSLLAATRSFEKCYELDPKDKRACFQLFLRSVNKKDYIKAFEYFDGLFTTNSPYYKVDANLYLYLLSFVTAIPEKYEAYMKALTLEDIKVLLDDRRFLSPTFQNGIIANIFNKRFSLALGQLKNSSYYPDARKPLNLVTIKLLYQILEAKKTTVIKLINQEDYVAVISLFEEQKNLQTPSVLEDYLLRLAQQATLIKEQKLIPVPKVLLTNNVFNAINNFNYSWARKLREDYCQANAIDANSDILFLLLDKICNLILTATTKKVDTEQPDLASSKAVADNTPKPNNYFLAKFIKTQKETYLKHFGISLLKKMSDDKITELSEYLAKSHPEIEMIVIENEHQQQVVLRCIDLSIKPDDIKSLMGCANAFFTKKDFEAARKTYLRLLQFKEIDPIVCERLGIIFSSYRESYSKIVGAINYFTLADYFYKQAGLTDLEHDFSGLIADLKLSISDKKACGNSPTPKTWAPDRKIIACEIGDLDHLTDYILASGLDIDTACEQLEMTPEQIDVVKLTYAKCYYIQGDYECGDKLLRAFEHSTNKTPNTIALYNEIRTNRYYLVNKRTEGAPRLTRSLKFRKHPTTK